MTLFCPPPSLSLDNLSPLSSLSSANLLSCFNDGIRGDDDNVCFVRSFVVELGCTSFVGWLVGWLCVDFLPHCVALKVACIVGSVVVWV